MNRYFIQVKRELWEHKGALIKTPIAVLIAFMVIALLAAMAGRNLMHDGVFISQHNDIISSYSFSSGNQHTFEYHNDLMAPSLPNSNMALPLPEMQTLSALPYIIFNHLAWLLTFTYLLSCLFTDRKDKSILFWKSMPVSEWQNVLTKVWVASVFIPAISWLSAMAFNLFLSILILAWSGITGLPSNIVSALAHQHMIATTWAFLGSNIATSLWMLPCTCWLLFASAYAKRTPFLYAALPLLALVVTEYFVVGSHHVSQIIRSYLSVNNPQTGQGMLYTSGWYQVMDVLTSRQFWLGLVASSAFLFGAVWCRKNRFENEE